MQFVGRGTAKITGKLTGSTSSVSISGVTADSTTPENAKTQIDKILDVVGQSIVTAGMTRTITEEAVE